ncbi:hypothetical protein ACFQ7F_36810 [Streptomyces sp. NPDC056486]|uniref:hypothetical protein n=1 Tax=Streptomyces sp. NPDC056486 TaxID=3345835 RepID=UPI00368819EF
MDVEIPEPIRTKHPPAGVNESIKLYSGNLSASSSTASFLAVGEITWCWLPTPRIDYEIASSDPEVLQWDMAEELAIGIPGGDIPEIDAGSGEKSPIIHARARLPEMSRGSKQDMRRVAFHVANMPMTMGDSLRDGGSWWRGRTMLVGNGWSIILDSRRDSKGIRDQLKEQGGFAITHTGQLQRAGGEAFAEEEANDALELLGCCLSFAFGRHIAPSLAEGYDSADQVVWQDWRARRISPWGTRHSIIDETRQSDLSDIFLHFAGFWEDYLMRDLLTHATHYYIEASDPNPIQLAASTAQAGLELLAYEKLVASGSMSSNRYGKNHAHQNMSALLAEYSIDDSIPATLASLTQAANTPTASLSGPQILARMRNGIMHPSREKPRYDVEAWLDAWSLARKYLILSTLGRIGFQGSIRDPIDEEKHVGKVTRVPWAAPPVKG